MKLLIVGDVHGRIHTLSRILREAQELYGIEGAIQVGDFGFYPQIMDQFVTELTRFRLPVWVIDGNHEDHEWLADMDRAAFGERRLHYVPRGTVLTIDGAQIGFCGGALNADRPQGLNVLTDVQADAAAATFNASAQLDLVVTHSCPSDIRIGMRGAPALSESVNKFITRAGYDAGPMGDCGEASLRRLWNQLTNRPKHWVFGHFHQQHQAQVGDTQFTCVGTGDATDGRHGQLPFIYDTYRRTFELASTERVGVLP